MSEAGEVLHAAVRAAGWRQVDESEFRRIVGPLWSRQEGDLLAYALLAEERHRNTFGVVHGGILMALADHTLGITAWAANGYRPQATVQFDMQLIAGAEPGDLIEVRPEIMRMTRSIIFMRGTMTVGERLVASINGVWKIRGGRSSEAGTGAAG